MDCLARTGCTFVLLVGALQVGCGSSSNNNSVQKPDAGRNDAGGGNDAGGDAGGDAGQFQLSGDVAPVEGSGTDCSSTSDTRKEGGCYGFFCGTNSNSLKAALSDDSVCSTTPEVWLICDGLGAREASRCAREHALDDDPREGMRMCLRDNDALDPFSDACLSCFLDSADCAREHCLTECLAGDNAKCDSCRETNKCTPDYYNCSGLANPM
jgi:hypothetical protein